VFQEKASRIGQIQIIRDTLKVAMQFVLLYRNVLDQDCLASHIDGDAGDFPLIGRDLGSPQRELTAPLQSSQKTTGCVYKSLAGNASALHCTRAASAVLL